MMTIKWPEIIKQVALELDDYKQQGYDKPTLRSMFYRLADVRQLIPNIRSSYVSLIKSTVKARMDGRLPKDCFYDEVRSVVIGFDEQYYTPNEWISYYIDKLRDMPNDYKSLIPRWHNQSNYVEVWTEKNAMIGSIRPLLKEKDVRLVPFSGYSSLSFLNEAADRINKRFSEGKKIHIFYYGDFDPSGVHMTEDLEERLGAGNREKKKMGLGIWDKIEQFRRVAITFEQRERYKLPDKPDAETEEKLMRDSRGPAFLAKYGRFYQNEIDSLPARIPGEFREMVTEPIDELFYEDIYQDVLEEYSVHDIRKILKDMVKLLSR